MRQRTIESDAGTQYKAVAQGKTPWGNGARKGTDAPAVTGAQTKGEFWHKSRPARPVPAAG